MEGGALVSAGAAVLPVVLQKEEVGLHVAVNGPDLKNRSVADHVHEVQLAVLLQVKETSVQGVHRGQYLRAFEHILHVGVDLRAQREGPTEATLTAAALFLTAHVHEQITVIKISH